MLETQCSQGHLMTSSSHDDFILMTIFTMLLGFWVVSISAVTPIDGFTVFFYPVCPSKNGSPPTLIHLSVALCQLLQSMVLVSEQRWSKNILMDIWRYKRKSDLYICLSSSILFPTSFTLQFAGKLLSSNLPHPKFSVESFKRSDLITTKHFIHVVRI